MRNKFVFIFQVIFLFKCFSQGQTYFNIVPYIGGIKNQSQALIVLPDSNEFYIIGELIDSSIINGQKVSRPFFSRFDLQGNLIATHIISDSLNLESYHINTRPVYKEDGSVLILIDKKNSQFGFNPCLLKLDIESGSILKSKIYSNAPSVDSSHTGEWYYQDQFHNIISFHYLLNENRIFIRRVDENFEIIKETLVDDNGRWNRPEYIEYDGDTTYTLVGTSISPPGGPFPEAKIFYLKVSESGNILDFKLMPDIGYKTVLFTSATSYTVLKDNQGNWIFSVGLIIVINKEDLIYNIVPVAVSMSANFDSIRWTNIFSNIPIDTFQFYNLTGSTWSTNKNGFVITGYDFAQAHRNSFITKIDNNGNIIWSRKFVPLGWNEEDFAWANIKDIKLTPYNNYIASGVIYDNKKGVRQPWLLQIDSSGCLMPDCDINNLLHEDYCCDNNKFSFYPNPTSGILYLSCNVEELDMEYRINLIDCMGRILKTMSQQLYKDDLYIINISEMPAGSYYIEVKDVNGKYTQVNIINKF